MHTIALLTPYITTVNGLCEIQLSKTLHTPILINITNNLWSGTRISRNTSQGTDNTLPHHDCSWAHHQKPHHPRYLHLGAHLGQRQKGKITHRGKNRTSTRKSYTWLPNSRINQRRRHEGTPFQQLSIKTSISTRNTTKQILTETRRTSLCAHCSAWS